MVFNTRILHIVAVGLAIGSNSCNLLRLGQNGKSPETAIILDTMELDFMAEVPPTYQIPPPKEIDIHHIELDLKFNWETEQVIGVATLDMSAYNTAQFEIKLNARGFEIRDITYILPDTVYAPDFSYDVSTLVIQPRRPLEKGDTHSVRIKYVATPGELDAGSGTAITSNQGLYFINPMGEVQGKPQQIWTQGEPECNSAWFPSVDYPHEKFTQDIFLTVKSEYHTISNGKLIYSEVHPDGTRTDYWKQALPHANYLVMLAIGEFSLVKDSWREKDVWYYLDPEYAPSAKSIFGNTPEMLEFYSTILDYAYPWDKYHQVVVKDFVSGAMENTSAVIHGDFVQLTDRELLDESHEDVIAHELFHHWFGDLVTCESWSQLTLNEGFATYGEYLWKEHKYGLEAARYHFQADLKAYLSEASYSPKSLIRNHYNSPDDIFDSHTYQKGGRVLHLLRLELGDSIFFQALNHYLVQNEFQSVELDDFRRSVEHVSGRSMRWFFDQWFEQEGHPQVAVFCTQSENRVEVVFAQNQPETWQTFLMHIPVEVYDKNGVSRILTFWLDQRLDTFSIELEPNELWYSVDPHGDLLWEFEETKPLDVWKQQLVSGPSFILKERALIHLLESDKEFAIAQGARLLDDPFWLTRSYGLNLISLGHTWNESVKAVLIETTQLDNNSGVRAAAYSALDSLSGGHENFNILYAYGLKDSSYSVIRTCLSILLNRDPCYAQEHVKSLEEEKRGGIPSWVSRVYASCPNVSQLQFFQRAYNESTGFDLFLIGNDFTTFAQNLNSEEVFETFAETLHSASATKQSWWSSGAEINGLEAYATFLAQEIERLESASDLSLEELEHISELRMKKSKLSVDLSRLRSTHEEKKSPFN